MKSFFIVAAMFMVSSCAVPSTLPPKIAWMGQPEGARSAFVRCVYLVAKSQCGSADVENPAIKSCITNILNTYRSIEEPKDRSVFLVENGCKESMAQLKSGEL